MTTALLDRPTETSSTTTTHTITVIDQPDRSLTWRSDRPDDVARAQALFAELTQRGYFAYRDTPRQDDGTTAEVIRTFAPDTDLRLMPVMVGG